jgi:hypothetical protein
MENPSWRTNSVPTARWFGEIVVGEIVVVSYWSASYVRRETASKDYLTSRGLMQEQVNMSLWMNRKKAIAT